MKTKIFGFHNGPPTQDATGYAISEHGHVVATHISSTAGWSRHDLGMDGRCTWKHEHYDKQFPDGWETEFVLCADVDTHNGLQAAFVKNNLLRKKENAEK